jgi:hypothetical protein
MDKKQISLWIDRSMADRLTHEAWACHMSVTEFIRQAIATVLDACKGGKR